MKEVQCKVLVLNGPPSSGKDTIAKAIKNYAIQKGLGIHNVVLEKFATPLKRVYPALLNKTNLIELEHLKDEEFYGVERAIRKLQIGISEDVMKPLFGKDIFAKLLVDRIKHLRKDNLCVISDCGFNEEWRYLYYRCAKENILTVRLTRNGLNFLGDSREYIIPPGERTDFNVIDYNNEIKIQDAIDGLLIVIAEHYGFEYDVTRLSVSSLLQVKRNITK